MASPWQQVHMLPFVQSKGICTLVNVQLAQKRQKKNPCAGFIEPCSAHCNVKKVIKRKRADTRQDS